MKYPPIRPKIKFGRWTVIKSTAPRCSGINRVPVKLWVCRCVCGTVAKVADAKLKTGWSKSCGCLGAEIARERHLTHGMSHIPEHSIWRSMKDRCTNPNNKAYRHYGRRGIKICPQWLASFSSFIADVGRRPSPSHSLERINNDGNYEPNNVTWATLEQQRNNYRKNARFTFNGKTLSMKQLSQTSEALRLGISYFTLRSRLRNLRWSVQRALTTPVGS